MRTIKLSVIAALAATAFGACTVREVDTPALSGPSSMARTIIMTADRDTLLQDGVQEAAIQIRAQVQPGQSENVRLRAQTFIDGVAQDFGTLSNKSPITPTTIFFRAPAPPATAIGQVPTRVTIRVTPDDQGDFRSEMSRELDLLLIPPGVILPSNPNLIAEFTFSPAAPRVFDIVTFDASTTTNAGVACRTNCTYLWNFGDGTSAEGMITVHQYRSVGSFPVTLTVTDLRGAQAIAIKPVIVSPGEPPTATFTFSPTEPQPNQAVFFNAGESKAAPGRVLVDFFWDFGDGTTASGVSVSKTYTEEATRVVTLKVTDDAGSFQTVTQTVPVKNP